MSNYDPVNALAEVLAPKNARARPLNELGFHQGIITAWNATTGENTVVIAGAPIEDVPMLNIGDTTNLAIGDNVAVLRYRNAYFIIGRVVMPNSDGFASAAFAFERIYADAGNFAIGTSDATVNTYSIPVPPWANFALISAHHELLAYNNTATRKQLYTSVWTPAWASSQNANLLLENTGGIALIGFTSAAVSNPESVTPGGSVLIEGRAMVFPSTVAADPRNQSHLTGFAIFTKI